MFDRKATRGPSRRGSVMFGQEPLAQLEGGYCPDHKVVDLSYVTYQNKRSGWNVAFSFQGLLAVGICIQLSFWPLKRSSKSFCLSYLGKCLKVWTKCSADAPWCFFYIFNMIKVLAKSTGVHIHCAEADGSVKLGLIGFNVIVDWWQCSRTRMSVCIKQSVVHSSLLNRIVLCSWFG